MRCPMISRLALAAALGLACLVAPRAGAQTCQAGYPGTCTIAGSATVTIAKVVSLQVSPASTTAPTPTSSDYTQGYNDAGGPVITVRSNTPWSVSINAATPLWSALPNGGAVPRANKPAADLLWTKTSGSGYVPFSTTAATIASGLRTTGTTVPLFYRVLYAITLDSPGIYSMDVVVTVVTP